MARLEQVLRGVKISQAKRGKQGGSRLPISVDILEKLRAAWATGERQDSTMLWAAAALCFFGFLRSGELTVPEGTSYNQDTHMSLEDVAVDNKKDPQMLRVRLKTSKTDPFRRGIDVYIGRTENKLCPVTAVLAYLKSRGAGKGPLFQLQNGRPLTRARFVIEVKKALDRAGIKSTHFSGHSFRSGAATTAAARGIGDATIKMLGRWNSSAYQVYIKTPRAHLAKVASALASVDETRK